MNIEHKNLVDFLQKVPIFSQLKPDDIEKLTYICREKNFSKDQVIFLSDEPCEGLFIVKTGMVKIFRTSEDGREQVMTEIRPGESFGDVAVMDDGNYPASASTLVESRLIVIDKKGFHNLLKSNAIIAFGLLKVYSQRLRLLLNLVEELSFESVQERIAKYFLRHINENDTRVKKWKGKSVKVKITHHELAEHIGSVREVVTRNLSRLAKKEILKAGNREIIILNVKRLEEICL